MRRCVLPAVVVLIALLAVPATVSAGLPRIAKANRKIVVGVSIGGVRLGDSLKRAKQVWGPGAACTTVGPGQSACTWKGGRNGQTAVNIKAGKVVVIAIQLGHKPQLGYYPAPLLSKVKLGRIGVGSPVALLKSAYKFPVLNTTGNSSLTIYTSNHKVQTDFGFDLDGKTEPIWSITMTAFR